MNVSQGFSRIPCINKSTAPKYVTCTRCSGTFEIEKVKGVVCPDCGGVFRLTHFDKLMSDLDIRAGDVVQIIDPEHPWFPALMYVSEVKPWGIQACVLMPEGNAKGSHCGRAYNRLDHGTYQRVGRAVIIEEGDAI